MSRRSSSAACFPNSSMLSMDSSSSAPVITWIPGVWARISSRATLPLSTLRTASLMQVEPVLSHLLSYKRRVGKSPSYEAYAKRRCSSQFSRRLQSAVLGRGRVRRRKHTTRTNTKLTRAVRVTRPSWTHSEDSVHVPSRPIRHAVIRVGIYVWNRLSFYHTKVTYKSITAGFHLTILFQRV
jgi:hypothetical protein